MSATATKKLFDRCVTSVRVSSVLCISLTLLIRIVTGNVSPVAFLFDVAACNAVMLLCPTRNERPKVSAVLSLIVASCAVCLSFADPDVERQAAVRVCHCFVVTLPLGMMELVNVRSFVKDDDFLESVVYGWDIALVYIRQFFMLSFLSFVFIAFVLERAGIPDVVTFSATGLMFCLYVILMVRSYTRKHIRPVKVLPLEKAESKSDVFIGTNTSAKWRLEYRGIYERMTRYMEDRKPFLSNTFSIGCMAQDLFTNKGYLSKAINLCTGLNFSQYVNRYRIAYAVALFKKDPHLKVTELSDMSGFANKVSFNMNFKLFMDGKTPKVWCDDYLGSRDVRRCPSSPEGQEPRRGLQSS